MQMAVNDGISTANCIEQMVRQLSGQVTGVRRGGSKAIYIEPTGLQLYNMTVHKSGIFTVSVTELMDLHVFGILDSKNGGKIISYIEQMDLLLFAPMAFRHGIARKSCIELMALHVYGTTAQPSGGSMASMLIS